MKFINSKSSIFLLVLLLSSYLMTTYSYSKEASSQTNNGSIDDSKTVVDSHPFIILQASDITLSGDKIKTALLHGDPSKEGLYIMRIRFPAGISSKPHYHDQDRYITVIEGIWNVGTSAKYDMENTTPIKAGGFMKHPAGKVHFDGAKDQAVTVEIRGMGPVKTTSVYQP